MERLRYLLSLMMLGAVVGAAGTWWISGEIVPVDFAVSNISNLLLSFGLLGSFLGAGLLLPIGGWFGVYGAIIGGLCGSLAGYSLYAQNAHQLAVVSFGLHGVGMGIILGVLFGFLLGCLLPRSDGPTPGRFFRADGVSMQRLQGQLDLLRIRAENHSHCKNPAIKQYLHQAAINLDRGHISVGYENLFAAEREMVACDRFDQLQVRHGSLQSECRKKLANTWRGRSARALLAGDERDVTPAGLQEAMRLLHGEYQNTYIKIALLQRQLSILALVLAVGLVVVLLLAQAGYILKPDGGSRLLVNWVVLLGMIGGALSAIRSVSQMPKTVKIPDVFRSWVSALIRPVIGGTTAFVTYLLIEGGLVKLTIGDSKHAATLIFAFIAGFSERWFMKQIEGLSGVSQGADGELGTGANISEENGTSTMAGAVYQAGVGAVVLRSDGRVLMCGHVDPSVSRWQFPESSIREKETPQQAVLRYLGEHLGLDPKTLHPIYELPEILTFEFPASLQSVQRGRGRSQRWFVYSVSDEGVASLRISAQIPEHKWVDLGQAVEMADEFKRGMYGNIVRQSRKQLDQFLAGKTGKQP